MSRILAVDPGEVRIGIAISDPSSRIASPHSIIQHESRQKNAQRISALAKEFKVRVIVVGDALDADGKAGLQSRKARRLAAAIREASGLKVELWDESDSSQEAEMAQRSISRKKAEEESLDDLAATVILQRYLDSLSQSIENEQ